MDAPHHPLESSEATFTSDLIPGGFFVYYADGDEEIIHANQYVLDLFECETFDEFMELTGGSFRGFVERSDFNAAEDSIWGQVEGRSGLDHVYYQVRTKTGRLVSIDDYGRLVQVEGERPKFYVFVVEMDQGSSIDWLTGLPGMERFKAIAQSELRVMASRGVRPAVVVFDLMGMKLYNDRRGRADGDNALLMFSKVLRTHFGSEACCRYGGDSFCTLTAIDGVEARVNRVFTDYAATGIEGVPPVMAGIYALREMDDISSALDWAQIACESDTQTWGSHLVWYSDEMHGNALMRLHVLENIDRALREGWVRPFYQGIVRSATGYLCGAEALARWIDPEFGQLSPAQFIPVLEEAGLLHKLDMHIIDCVLADLAERLRLGMSVVPISVNVSLRDLGDMDVANVIAHKVADAHLPADLLRVEFTEAVASENPALLKRQINLLHQHGFEVWMDDFGSGYSSLNTLKEFNFDLIKLDMEFLRGSHLDKGGMIVDGVIRMAKRLGIKTLAEGVEVTMHAYSLVSMGCDILQGFLYFKPMPFPEMNKYASMIAEIPMEPRDEVLYWDSVGAVSLADLTSNGYGEDVSATVNELPVTELPAGVLEKRGGVWYVLRANEPLYRILHERSQFDAAMSSTLEERVALGLDSGFEHAVARCSASMNWERVSGAFAYDSGFQFYVKPIASCSAASAFLVVSAPSLLGAGLGTYGDVPVGYAVMRVIYSEERDRAVNAEYVYANGLYHMWGGLGNEDITGKLILDIIDEEGHQWLPLFYRAARYGESMHDLVYSNKARHWISYNLSPSPIPDHCIFAFTIADVEQREREELRAERDAFEAAGTHDALTGLLNRRGIDNAVALQMRRHSGEPFILSLIDLDDFKSINDLYGHDVGDEALRVLSRSLLKVFPSTAVIGRNGGDEALVALFGEDAHRAEELLATLTSHKLVCESRGRRYPLSVSIGYAWCHPVGDLKTAYTHADEALYAVKLSGRSGYRAWDPSLDESPQRSLLGFTTRDLAEGMPLAMLAHRTNGEILFANDGLARLLGYGTLTEALAATNHSMRNFVYPADWPHVKHVLTFDAITALPGEEHNVRFRITTRSGEVHRVVYRSRLIMSAGKGDILYAYMVEAETLV